MKTLRWQEEVFSFSGNPGKNGKDGYSPGFLGFSFLMEEKMPKERTLLGVLRTKRQKSQQQRNSSLN